MRSFFTETSHPVFLPLCRSGVSQGVDGAAPADAACSVLSWTAALAETQCALTLLFSPTILHPHHLFTAQEQEMPSEMSQLYYNRT